MYKDYIFDFNPEKNAWLQKTRGICFDDLIPLLEERAWLDIIKHPLQNKYPGQMLAIFALNEECYVVPFVIDEDQKRIFLKTIYPSRKARKIYMEGDAK